MVETLIFSISTRLVKCAVILGYNELYGTCKICSFWTEFSNTMALFLLKILEKFMLNGMVEKWVNSDGLRFKKTMFMVLFDHSACLLHVPLLIRYWNAGARRIRENQKPPNSRNKNRQIEEPRLQILESLKNLFSEYKPYSVRKKIEIVSSMVYSSKIVSFCWIIDIFNFVLFCT